MSNYDYAVMCGMESTLRRFQRERTFKTNGDALLGSLAVDSPLDEFDKGYIHGVALACNLKYKLDRNLWVLREEYHDRQNN